MANAIYTDIYVKITDEGNFEEDIKGHIPALKVESSINGGKMLFVITGSKDLSFVGKSILWDVLQFSWNIITKKWDMVDTHLWKNSQMWVNDTTPVNEQGIPCAEQDKFLSEAMFYIEGLGKQAIYPALLGSMKRKIKAILEV